MTEALKIQLDNVTRELQALQVENARLREANPEITSVIDAKHKELEELRQNLYDSHECEIQTKQEQVDILISKNQARQILYLKHPVYNETT